MKELVRKAYYLDRKSERQIARDLRIHRKTVKQLLKEDDGTPPSFQRKNWESPVIEQP